MEIIKNLFYWFFGKALARFIGIECYAKKLNVGTRIRIRYLRNRPSVIYISEFGYVYKEARFQ